MPYAKQPPNFITLLSRDERTALNTVHIALDQYYRSTKEPLTDAIIGKFLIETCPQWAHHTIKTALIRANILLQVYIPIPHVGEAQ